MATALDELNKLMGKSVQEFPSDVDPLGGIMSVIIPFLVGGGDDIPPWGTKQVRRDQMLRQFWPTEPFLASAVYNVSAKNANFKYTIEGPPRLRKLSEAILENADFGRGFMSWVIRTCIDIYTQDNGAFVELIRPENKATAPVFGIAHLDAGRCVRTGNPQFPVLYCDMKMKWHKLASYQVRTLEEFISPVESLRGMQYCAVSRALQAAKIVYNIGVYTDEKVSGRFARALHIVSGPTKKEVQDAMESAGSELDNVGLTRYSQPVVMAALDPTQKLGHIEIPLAMLPEGFNEEIMLKWYVAKLAAAFGVDYPELAPLPGGNLGTAQQSEILNQKARSKGPALFMGMMTNLMRYVMVPRTEFGYEQQDVQAALDRAELAVKNARERSMRLKSGEIDIDTARQLALKAGDLTEEMYNKLKEAESLEEIPQREPPEQAEQPAPGEQPTPGEQPVGTVRSEATDDDIKEGLRRKEAWGTRVLEDYEIDMKPEDVQRIAKRFGVR